MNDAIVRSDIDQLMGVHGTCVSIYIPTVATGRERLESAVRLKNQLEKAHRLLVEKGMRSTIAWDLLEPGTKLHDDKEFWVEQSRGLALFFAEGFTRINRLRVAVPELTIVGTSFHIRPLLSCSEQEKAYVLALDGKDTRVLRLAGETAELIQVPDMPTSIDEAIGSEYLEKQQTAHSLGRQGMIAHGAGDLKNEQKDRDLRFCQAVDRALVKFLNGSKAALILAADEPILSIYRRHNRYEGILEDVIAGNPRRLSVRDLASQAEPIMEKLHDQKAKHLLERYENSKPLGRAEEKLDQVLAMATAGRVDVLFTDPLALKWGFTGDDGRALLADDQAAGAEDLINLAAIETLKNSGDVIEVTTPEIHEIGVAALLRY